MRTTVTLDDDVVAEVEAERRRTGKTFKAVVNDALRAGLRAGAHQQPMEPFRVQARGLGLRRGLSYDNVAELLEHVEGPGYG